MAPGSVAAIVGQLCALANPARDWPAGPGPGTGGPGPGSRGALTLRRFALAVSAIYLGFTRRSDSRQAAAAGLVYGLLLVVAVTPGRGAAALAGQRGGGIRLPPGPARTKRRPSLPLVRAAERLQQ
jgi:hypothetical protein